MGQFKYFFLRVDFKVDNPGMLYSYRTCWDLSKILSGLHEVLSKLFQFQDIDLAQIFLQDLSKIQVKIFGKILIFSCHGSYQDSCQDLSEKISLQCFGQKQFVSKMNMKIDSIQELLARILAKILAKHSCQASCQTFLHIAWVPAITKLHFVRISWNLGISIYTWTCLIFTRGTCCTNSGLAEI